MVGHARAGGRLSANAMGYAKESFQMAFDGNPATKWYTPKIAKIWISYAYTDGEYDDFNLSEIQGAANPPSTSNKIK